MNHTLETNSKKSKKRTFKILKETKNVAFTTRNKKTFLEFLRDIFSVLEQINYLNTVKLGYNILLGASQICSL
jgi:hypothetical protein